MNKQQLLLSDLRKLYLIPVGVLENQDALWGVKGGSI